jgi:hypothetical protein
MAKKSIDLPTFKKKIVESFCEKITDKVFLMIQNDRELMHDYLQIIAQNNTVANVNSQIAKAIKDRFKLENKHFKNSDPESVLIQTHEVFEFKS